MFFNLVSNKEEKEKRLAKLINFIEKIFNKFTDNKSLIGYTILLLHCLLIAAIFGYVIFNNITAISFAVIVCILLCILIINLYYGRGCTLVKLERHFFDNKEWYGPVTIFYIIFNISTKIENKHMSENISIIGWICFTILLFYKLYQTNKKI